MFRSYNLNLNFAIFWHVAACSLYKNWNFGETYHRRYIPEGGNICNFTFEDLNSWRFELPFTLFFHLIYLRKLDINLLFCNTSTIGQKMKSLPA
jgi:hypothetical protein